MAVFFFWREWCSPMVSNVLSHSDVAELLSDPSVAKREETARKIAADFDRGSLSDAEKKLAEEIFRLMVKDAEVRVREALANNLKSNPLVPRDVAVSLAMDVNSVALPILESSEVLTDEDLLEIIGEHDPDKQTAIAGRPSVSETVSDAIVDTQNEAVVSRLVSNPGAEISDGSLGKVVDTLGERSAIQDAMVRRPRLPVTVSERLVTLVSKNMMAEIESKIDLAPSAMTDLVLQIRERAILSLSFESGKEELERLVTQLRKKKRLTPSILLRSLCVGDLAFFEAGIAELAGISARNARELIHDDGGLGLRALAEKAGIQRKYFPAIRAAVDVARETQYDGGEHDRERYARRMIERILTQYGDLGVDLEADDLDFLLRKMDALPIDPPEGA